MSVYFKFTATPHVRTETGTKSTGKAFTATTSGGGTEMFRRSLLVGTDEINLNFGDIVECIEGVDNYSFLVVMNNGDEDITLKYPVAEASDKDVTVLPGQAFWIPNWVGGSMTVVADSGEQPVEIFLYGVIPQ